MQDGTMSLTLYGNIEELYTKRERSIVSVAKTLDTCVVVALKAGAYITQLPGKVGAIVGRYVALVDEEKPQGLTEKIEYAGEAQNGDGIAQGETALQEAQHSEQTALVVNGSIGTSLERIAVQYGQSSHNLGNIVKGFVDKSMENNPYVRIYHWLGMRKGEIEKYKGGLDADKERDENIKKSIDERVGELIGDIALQRSNITELELEQEGLFAYRSDNRRIIEELALNLAIQAYTPTEELETSAERDRCKRKILVVKEEIKGVNAKLSDLKRSNTRDEEHLKEELLELKMYDDMMGVYTAFSEKARDEYLMTIAYMNFIKTEYAKYRMLQDFQKHVQSKNIWGNFQEYVQNMPDLGSIIQEMRRRIGTIKKEHEEDHSTSPERKDQKNNADKEDGDEE